MWLPRSTKLQRRIYRGHKIHQQVRDSEIKKGNGRSQAILLTIEASTILLRK
jgi:hypothetical protein